MNNRFFSKVALGLIAAALTTALGSTAGCARKHEPMNAVSGKVSLREPAAFSDQAVAYVRLADVTKGTVNSTTVVQKEIRPADDGSIPFALVYKEKQINPHRAYAVDVRVVDHGRLVFISDGAAPVITKGHGNELDLTVERPGGH